MIIPIHVILYRLTIFKAQKFRTSRKSGTLPPHSHTSVGTGLHKYGRRPWSLIPACRKRQRQQTLGAQFLHDWKRERRDDTWPLGPNPTCGTKQRWCGVPKTQTQNAGLDRGGAGSLKPNPSIWDYTVSMVPQGLILAQGQIQPMDHLCSLSGTWGRNHHWPRKTGIFVIVSF